MESERTQNVNKSLDPVTLHPRCSSKYRTMKQEKNCNLTHVESFNPMTLPEMNIKVDQHHLVLQSNPIPEELLARSNRQDWYRRLGFGFNREEFKLLPASTTRSQDDSKSLAP